MNSFNDYHSNQANFNQFIDLINSLENKDQLEINHSTSNGVYLSKQKSKSLIERIKNLFYKPKEQRLKTIAEFTVKQFENNLDLASENLGLSLAAVKKAKKLLGKNKKLKKSFKTIQKQLEAQISNTQKACAEALKEIKDRRQSILDKAEKRAENIKAEAKKQGELEGARIKEELKKEGLDKFEKATFLADEMETDIKAHEIILKQLQSKMESFYDVIFTTSDGEEIATNSSLFKDCTLINSLFPLDKSRFKIEEATDEQKSKHPSVKYVLRIFEGDEIGGGFTGQAIRKLQAFYVDASFHHQIKSFDFDELMELYQIADFVGSDNLKNLCKPILLTKDNPFKQKDNQFKQLEQSLSILTSSSILPDTDPLVQEAIRILTLEAVRGINIEEDYQTIDNNGYGEQFAKEFFKHPQSVKLLSRGVLLQSLNYLDDRYPQNQAEFLKHLIELTIPVKNDPWSTNSNYDNVLVLGMRMLENKQGLSVGNSIIRFLIKILAKDLMNIIKRRPDWNIQPIYLLKLLKYKNSSEEIEQTFPLFILNWTKSYVANGGSKNVLFEEMGTKKERIIDQLSFVLSENNYNRLIEEAIELQFLPPDF